MGYRYSRCRTYGTYRCGKRITPSAVHVSGDNVGQIGIDSSGHLDISVGSGLAIDLTDGDLVVDISGTNLGIDIGW